MPNLSRRRHGTPYTVSYRAHQHFTMSLEMAVACPVCGADVRTKLSYVGMAGTVTGVVCSGCGRTYTFSWRATEQDR